MNNYEESLWNARLVEYSSKIVTGGLRIEDIDNMLFDLVGFCNDYQYSDRYGNKKTLLRRIGEYEVVLKLIAKKFNCRVEDIYVGDLDLNSIRGNRFPYSVVIGNLDASDRSTTLDAIHFINHRKTGNKDMSKLRAVIGNADFTSSSDSNLQNLMFVSGDFSITGKREDLKIRIIGGNATFAISHIEDLSSLIYVGGDLNCPNSEIEDMSSLKEVKGSILKLPKGLDGMPNLILVGKDLIVEDPSHSIKSFPKLQTVRGKIETRKCSKLLSAFFAFKFKKTQEGYIRRSLKDSR